MSQYNHCHLSAYKIKLKTMLQKFVFTKTYLNHLTRLQHTFKKNLTNSIATCISTTCLLCGMENKQLIPILIN